MKFSKDLSQDLMTNFLAMKNWLRLVLCIFREKKCYMVMIISTGYSDTMKNISTTNLNIGKYKELYFDQCMTNFNLKKITPVKTEKFTVCKQFRY